MGLGDGLLRLKDAMELAWQMPLGTSGETEEVATAAGNSWCE